jgi:hypothetical protein
MVRFQATLGQLQCLPCLSSCILGNIHLDVSWLPASQVNQPDLLWNTSNKLKFHLGAWPIISTGLTFTAFCSLNIISWQLPDTPNNTRGSIYLCDVSNLSPTFWSTASMNCSSIVVGTTSETWTLQRGHAVGEEGRKIADMQKISSKGRLQENGGVKRDQRFETLAAKSFIVVG